MKLARIYGAIDESSYSYNIELFGSDKLRKSGKPKTEKSGKLSKSHRKNTHVQLTNIHDFRNFVFNP